MSRDGPILVAGGGIAGLTGALAFAQQGFGVEVFERAERLEEAGAGIQLSPNATRILFSLGLSDALLAVAPRPEQVVLIDAKSLRELAHVPLGAWGEARWGAPYLTCRRADLQRILLEAVLADSRIAFKTGASVVGADLSGESSRLILDDRAAEPASGAFLVAADGVHSTARKSLLRGGGGTTSTPSAPSRVAEPTFTGLTAWRAVADEQLLSILSNILRADRVSAFLKPQAHLVAYPTGEGSFNLVAFAATHGQTGSTADADGFRQAFSDAAPVLKNLVEGISGWTAWPLLTAPEPMPWLFESRAALIGDAAHAMTPFAAQGAAMAIEDAATLAAAFAETDGSLEARLTRWERLRRARIAQVVRRGKLNRLAWHATGPVAAARNLVLKLRSPEKLAADLDWLYGWRPA